LKTWLSETGRDARRALVAAYAGYGLDAFDFMVYSFIIPSLRALWGMNNAQAGSIATAALVTSSIGGWAAGVLADRFGRARVLQLTVIWFSAFTFLCAFTDSYAQLFWMRALQGFGFGGEWAVGSILVAESIAARHRGKAAGLVQSSWSVGWAAAALVFWWAGNHLAPALAWRVVFGLGLLPAFLLIYIRRNVAEPEIYLRGRGRSREHFLAIFQPPLLARTVLSTLLATGMMGAYYSVATWLPAYLATERHLTVDGTTSYLLTVICGSLAGYLTSGWLADKIGRRLGFIFFAACGAVLVVLYTHMPVNGIGMALIGFPVGFFILGVFSGMGAFLAELYPSALRGSGQGFTYSLGRGLGGLCPLVIGGLSSHWSLADAIGGFTVAAYALVIVTSCLLPETRGRTLDDPGMPTA
jgi:MFS family permease